MIADFPTKVMVLVLLLFSVILHELSHGAVADANGDPTPRLAGRLTWNPLAHLDPLGTLFILIIVFTNVPFFGWAKPVPINPTYFRNYRKGMLMTALAGPFANFSLLILFMGILYFMFITNAPAGTTLAYALAFGMIINFMLMLFNLLPIPPLDGSKVLAQFLSWKQQTKLYSLEAYGFIILIVLLFTGLLGKFLQVALLGFGWITLHLFGQGFTVYLLNAARISLNG
jgi:Zn-dependent protease